MAIERFNDALEQDETYIESHIRLAYRYQAAEEHDLSIGHFQRAIELDPTVLSFIKILVNICGSWIVVRSHTMFAQYQVLGAEHGQPCMRLAV